MKFEDLDDDVKLLLTGWNEDEYDPFSSIGAKLKNNNKSVADQLIAAINSQIETKEDISSALALECFAMYGHNYFQELVDEQIFAAFESNDDSLVFCGVACYHEISKNARPKARPIIKRLCEHSDRDVRRTSKCLIDHYD